MTPNSTTTATTNTRRAAGWAPTALPAIARAPGDLPTLAADALAARAAVVDQRATVKRLERELRRARTVDADVAAAAITAGRKVPAPTETKLRAELDDAVRNLAAVTSRSRTASARLLDDLRAGPGDQWAEQLDHQLAATVAEIAAKLHEVVELIEHAGDNAAARTWLRTLHHRPPGGLVPSVRAFSPSAELAGFNVAPLDLAAALLAGVHNALNITSDHDDDEHDEPQLDDDTLDDLEPIEA